MILRTKTAQSTLFLISLILGFSHTATGAETTISPTNTSYDYFLGLWQRTDGNYSLKVSDVQQDGSAKVEYFNPSPIHVSETSLSTQKELLKLFVKLEDKAYAGSTYTLYYYADKDALAGFYYQAALDETYEVIFLRKKE